MAWGFVTNSSNVLDEVGYYGLMDFSEALYSHYGLIPSHRVFDARLGAETISRLRRLRGIILQ